MLIDNPDVAGRHKGQLKFCTKNEIKDGFKNVMHRRRSRGKQKKMKSDTGRMSLDSENFCECFFSSCENFSEKLLRNCFLLQH